MLKYAHDQVRSGFIRSFTSWLGLTCNPIEIAMKMYVMLQGFQINDT